MWQWPGFPGHFSLRMEKFRVSLNYENAVFVILSRFRKGLVAAAYRRYILFLEPLYRFQVDATWVLSSWEARSDSRKL
jgi:hypothetical protein